MSSQAVVARLEVYLHRYATQHKDGQEQDLAAVATWNVGGVRNAGPETSRHTATRTTCRGSNTGQRGSL